jgi:hypothetical protein
MGIKLLRDYTGAELEELSEQQVQRLVDLECAEAGLPFAPDPPPPYAPLKQEHDVRLYQVGKTDILVDRREKAEEIAAFLRQHELWTNEVDWRFGYVSVGKRSEDALEVAAVDSYSLAKLQARKDALAKDAEAKKAHEEATQAYSKACEARQNVSDAVWKVAYAAWRFRGRREELEAQLKRCVELAEGNEAIGLRFFEKANSYYRDYFTVAVDGDTLRIDRKHFANPDRESEVEAA